ncbi:hypothetical protein KIL84_002753 [Mauremys mutica]|uniref:Uncharacterized protein n=1 Tax=Mauremys mutica TaxID=74926 RepID=A0A9D3WUF7_9SAUR|nr:hypothetical protein KIL84_002753 [Mauremys mutica]
MTNYGSILAIRRSAFISIISYTRVKRDGLTEESYFFVNFSCLHSMFLLILKDGSCIQSLIPCHVFHSLSTTTFLKKQNKTGDQSFFASYYLRLIITKHK